MTTKRMKVRSAAQTAADNDAWGLVIEIERGQRYHSPYFIANQCGISAERVRQMSARYRLMHRAGVQPTGDWWHDRVNVVLPVKAA